jgi:hypothetical protein
MRVSILQSLEIIKNEHAAHMDNGALWYLSLVNDKEQYPAARCRMG